MKKWMLSAVVGAALLWSNPLHTSAKEVLISYSEQQLPKIKHLLQQQRYTILPAVQTIAADLTPTQIANLQRTLPQLAIEQDRIVETAAATESTSLLPPWNVQLVQKQATNGARYTGKGVKIAIIDTGVNTIPALKKQIKQRVSFAKDDAKTALNESDVVDRGHGGNGHGTFVASIISAAPAYGLLGNNDFVGIAPNASLYSVKYSDGTKNGTVAGIIKAIDWSIQQNMDLINLSSGLPRKSELLHEAIKKATKAGIIVISSTGNDGQVANLRYPARYAETISVGSINRQLAVSSFSNNIPQPNSYAPGEAIPALNNKGALKYVNGTSFSAPHITGLFALLKERYPYSTSSMLVAKYDSFVNAQKIPTVELEPVKMLPAIAKAKVRVTDHGATFQWQQQEARQTIVTINRKKTVYTSKVRYQLTNLPANKAGVITLRSLDREGNWSPLQTVPYKTLKDVTKPAKPTKLQAKKQKNRKVKLMWTQKKPADFSHYVVYRNGKKIAKTKKKTYVTGALSKKKTYSYQIYAVDTSNNKAASKKIKVKL